MFGYNWKMLDTNKALEAWRGGEKKEEKGEEEKE